MTLAWRPLDDAVLPDALAGWLADTQGTMRVAVDGAPATAPETLAERLIDPLRARGRAAVHVRASRFWRDASLRLEHGHEDVDSYPSWLDADALRREVLLPAVQAGIYLPSLRDPFTNRSTREAPRPLDPGSVLLVSGTLLLGLGLPFDRVVHLTMPADALARRTAEAWTLPAFAEYDATVRPVDAADVAVRVDRRTPAVRGLP